MQTTGTEPRRGWIALLALPLLLAGGCAATSSPERSAQVAEDVAVSRIMPSLMFEEGHAEEAMDLYASLFPGSRVERLDRWGAGEPGTEGAIKQAVLVLGAPSGQRMLFSDTSIDHGFTFTPSIAFHVDCDDEAHLQHLFERLSEGGEVMMPPADYGFSRRFAWVSDRFGVSWQLNLP